MMEPDSRPDAIRAGEGWLLVLLALFLAVNVSLAYVQYFVLWPGLAEQVPLVRAGRVIGLFILPSTFTVYTLALLLVMLRFPGVRLQPWLAGLLVVWVAPTLVLARSIILVPALVLALSPYLAHPRVQRLRLRGRHLVGAGLVLVLLFVFLVRLREVTFPNLWLRIQNWWIAVRMALDHLPWGTGSYGYWFQYRRYMPPGANETRLAHSLPLQVFAEWGVPAFLAVLIGYLVYIRDSLRAIRRDPEGIPWVGAAWLVLFHNAFDVGVFDYRSVPLAVVFLFYPYRARARPRSARLGGALALLALVVLGLRIFNVYPGMPLDRYLAPGTRGPVPEAHTIRALQSGVARMPWDLRCTRGLARQPYDVGLYHACMPWSLQQADSAIAGWYAYRALQVAPHLQRAREIWRQWRSSVVPSRP